MLYLLLEFYFVGFWFGLLYSIIVNGWDVTLILFIEDLDIGLELFDSYVCETVYLLV
jgi:hypothetical protein